MNNQRKTKARIEAELEQYVKAIGHAKGMREVLGEHWFTRHWESRVEYHLKNIIRFCRVYLRGTGYAEELQETGLQKAAEKGWWQLGLEIKRLQYLNYARMCA